MHQTTVGQLPDPRDPFVGRVVVFEVLALEVFAALPPVVGPDEENADVVLRAFTDHEVVARQAAGFVDQGGSLPPANVAEHGLVQRGQDALENVLLAH